MMVSSEPRTSPSIPSNAILFSSWTYDSCPPFFWLQVPPAMHLPYLGIIALQQSGILLATFDLIHSICSFINNDRRWMIYQTFCGITNECQPSSGTELALHYFLLTCMDSSPFLVLWLLLPWRSNLLIRCCWWDWNKVHFALASLTPIQIEAAELNLGQILFRDRIYKYLPVLGICLLYCDIDPNIAPIKNAATRVNTTLFCFIYCIYLVWFHNVPWVKWSS